MGSAIPASADAAGMLHVRGALSHKHVPTRSRRGASRPWKAVRLPTKPPSAATPTSSPIGQTGRGQLYHPGCCRAVSGGNLQSGGRVVAGAAARLSLKPGAGFVGSAGSPPLHGAPLVPPPL